MIQITPITTPFSVCKLASIPTEPPNHPFTFTGYTDEEYSLVLPTYCAPDQFIEREDGWRGFRIQGVLDFSFVGILAKISTLLAENNISIFAVSTYNTDYILVKEQFYQAALSLLVANGYELLKPISAIEIIPAYDHLDDLAGLIKEYTDTIIEEGGEIVRKTLENQHLDEELKDLEKKYGYPSGRCYIAYVDGMPAGSAALLRNDDNYAELKRLYIRPDYRGHHLAQRLIEQIISDAKVVGYQYLRLDTFSTMKAAINLYHKYGFEEIEAYNDNPSPFAVFLQKNL